jgi:hypothetical protein
MRFQFHSCLEPSARPPAREDDPRYAVTLLALVHCGPSHDPQCPDAGVGLEGRDLYQ